MASISPTPCAGYTAKSPTLNIFYLFSLPLTDHISNLAYAITFHFLQQHYSYKFLWKSISYFARKSTLLSLPNSSAESVSPLLLPSMPNSLRNKFSSFSEGQRKPALRKLLRRVFLRLAKAVFTILEKKYSSSRSRTGRWRITIFSRDDTTLGGG